MKTNTLTFPELALFSSPAQLLQSVHQIVLQLLKNVCLSLLGNEASNFEVR